MEPMHVAPSRPGRRAPPVQPNVTMTKPVFTPEECAAIRALGADLGQGEIYRQDGGAAAVEARIRDGYADNLPHGPKTNWIYEKLTPHVMGINGQYYHFEISEVILQLARYEAGHFYDWHVDMIHEPDTSRKLSFSVQLSDGGDYEGGALEFMLGTNRPAAPRTQGIIAFFPAYVLHRVLPVSRGVRWSLVGWCYGPHFR